MSTTDTPDEGSPASDLLLRRALQALCAVAAAAGAKLGYGFGTQIGGLPVGLVAAANCALFGWMIAGSVAHPVQRWLQRRRPRP